MRWGSCCTLVLMLVVTACVPPAPSEGFPRRFNVDTVMGEAQAAGVVAIGIAAGAPPLGYSARPRGTAAGFTTTLGKIVASTLHVNARFVLASSDQLLHRVDHGKLAIAFPALPVTERLVRQHSFSDPYLVTHQMLLVRASSRVRTPADLAGKPVCSFIDPHTGVELERLEPTVTVTSSRTPARCAALFSGGKVAAVTAERVYLDGMRGPGAGVEKPVSEARIVGDQLNTVGYSAVVKAGAAGWLQFVDAVLAQAESDGRWERAYRRWTGATPGALPTLTVEEAAALFPAPTG